MSPMTPSFDALREDPEWVELTRQAKILQQPPWSFSGKWISQAMEAIQAGRVSLGTPASVVAEIVGKDGEIYTITGNACDCPARKMRKECYHPTAAELYRLYHGKMRVASSVSREPGDDPIDEEDYIPEPPPAEKDEAPMPTPETDATPTPQSIDPEQLKTLRQTIVKQLTTLGCKLSTKIEFEEAVMVNVGLVLAPENFGLITERLQELVEAHAKAPQPPRAGKEYMVTIKGKDFITYQGLLAMAHEQGLQSIRVEFVTLTAGLATALASVTFKDGRTFTEAADATPENVNKAVQQHFARCALTRAKARALRDALNIGEVALEESAE